MDNQITFYENVEAKELTERQLKARREHQSILVNAHAARANMLSCCQSLKKIRDEKLYIEFGFNLFEDYTVSAHNIKQRQAYNLISVAENNSNEFLQANANLELTKLIALSSLPPEEKQQFVNEHNIDEMSTRAVLEEVKRLKEELNNKEKQISLMEQETLELNEKLSEEKPTTAITVDGNLIQKAAREIADNEIDKAKKIADVQLEEIKKEANAKVDKYNKEIKCLAADVEKYKEEAERLLPFEQQVQQSVIESEKLKKKITLSTNPELTKFKFIFEDWQGLSTKLINQLCLLDEETKSKCEKAINAIIERWAI